MFLPLLEFGKSQNYMTHHNRIAAWEDPWRLRREKMEGLKFPQASDENIGNLSVANGR